MLAPDPAEQIELPGELETEHAVRPSVVVVLLVSGLIEGFVTPSGLPTWARISVGALALLAFFAYCFVLGRPAARAGESGDLEERYAGDSVPVSG